MSKNDDAARSTIELGLETLNSSFAENEAAEPLRVCCYGSSSAQTPRPYLEAAAALGYYLARRGHTCVNGAGSYGCMAAMNDGAALGNGHIVGVIHEMWLVDDWSAAGLRDGGAHEVFGDTAVDVGGSDTGNKNRIANLKQRGSNNKNAGEGPIREILVAGGNDLQARKRLLVEGADGLIVLPGGPGTWDELWEMACARNIGLTQLPIVCVNVDGYYDPFKAMLERAHRDRLTKHAPEEIVKFAQGPQEAIEWLEREAAKKLEPRVKLGKRNKALRSASFFHTPVTGGTRSVLHTLRSSARSVLRRQYERYGNGDSVTLWAASGLMLGIGFAAGCVFTNQRLKRS